MKQTSKHSLYQPEQDDDVIDTINKLSDNFASLDVILEESTDSLSSYLQEGIVYNIGRRVWNKIPAIGGILGWINVRDGKFAPTWQERTSYNIGDIIMTKGNNGHIYQCIENGTSGISEPVFTVVVDSQLYDDNGRSSWVSNTVYNLDDIVISTDGNELFYYKCTREGTSDITEPIWTLASGSTINDATVIWQSYKTVKWKEIGASCNFREFGNIL